MFSKTEFRPSKCVITQRLSDSTSPKKKRKLSNTGRISMLSNSNSRRPNIYLSSLSMMDLLLQLELLIMVTSQLELSRMWSVGMRLRLVTTSRDDLDGIVMDFLSSMKSTSCSESTARLRSCRWESTNTTQNAKESWWDSQDYGSRLSLDSEDGLILRTTTRLWTSISWNQSGMSLKCSMRKGLSIEAEELCHILMHATPCFRISRFNKITNKWVILLSTSLSLWKTIRTSNSWPGRPPLGHFLAISSWQSILSSPMWKSNSSKTIRFSSLQNADLKTSSERKSLRF